VKNLLSLIIIFLFALKAFSQSGNCPNAAPFCTGTTYTFNNQTNNGDVGSLHCLSTTPNPVWYYMQIDVAGPMTFTISQQNASGGGLDVDYALWGPFNSLTAACNGTGNTPVGCSYSSSATETATIPNAQVGQIYLLLLTNYSNNSGTITFNQTSGSGSANCSFTCGVTGFTAVPTACSGNSEYTLNGTLNITNPPATGTMTVSSSCGGTQTFNAPFGTTINYSLPNLTANGAACTATVSFSDNPNCNTLAQYNAPAACAPSCGISGITATPSACNSANNTFSVAGNVSFTIPPATGTLTVTSSCGGTQTFNAPFTSPLAYNLTGLTATGGNCSITASFSAATCTGSQNFTSPAPCGCVISAITANPTACANDLYNVTGNVTFSAAPATGTLTITNSCGGAPQVFNAPFTSPQAYSFNGLNANGANCNITATFSGVSCTRTQPYSAPAACLNPPCIQNPFCSNNGAVTFPAGTNQTAASVTYPGNNYGCLGSSPNPEWYYMQIAQPGTLGISMTNSSNVDIDYILYGPYSSYNNAITYCNSFGTSGSGSTVNTVVDCSYSSSANESANIANAQTGEVYVLLITNYSNQPTNITFSSSGTATTDCSIVTPAVCNVDVGTYNTNITGNTIATTKLCYGDSLSITSNNDFVPPTVVTGGTNPPTFDPGIAWLVYSCPPTVALTPAQAAATNQTVPDDPCLVGIYNNTPNLTDVNDMSLINSVPAGTFTNNTVYFVPITMYSNVDGIYSYVISPANDCYELGTPIAIQYLPEINAVVNPNCANGTASITLTGGAPQIDGSNFNVVPNSQIPASVTFVNTTVGNGGTIIIGNLTDGPFSFDVVDDNGCPKSISGVFVGPQSAALTYPDNLYCLNEPSPIPTMIGTPGGTYSSGQGLSLDPATGIIDLSTSTPGAYAITYNTPGPQCPAQSTFNLTIEDYPIVSGGDDITICVGKQITLSGSGASSYSWNNGLQNNVPYLPNFGLTEFVVIGTSSGGCVNSDTVLVTVIGDCDPPVDVIFWVPNTFTPDGDQYNQTFFPVFYEGFDPFAFDFYIYNRWGELIWESHDVTVGWDGTYYDGLKCQDGAYTWKIRFKLLNNDEKRTVIGHVNLIR